MALIVNDPYGGGQELINPGRSQIPLRETFGASAEGIRSQYSDQMRNVASLTEALSGFTKSVGAYEKKQEEEELKYTNTLAAQIFGELKGDLPVGEQVAARFPQASYVLQARVSETLGMWHASTQAQKFIEQAMTDPTLTTPEAVQARLTEKLAEESARVGKQHFYGPSYIDTMSKLFMQRGNEMAAERVRKMETISVQGMEMRLKSRIEAALGPKGDGVGATAPITSPSAAQPAGPVDDAFTADGVEVKHSFDVNAPYGRAASENPQQFSNIVLHHAVGKTDALVKYGQRVDPQRGGSFGYHFYIDPDGTIVQGAPMSKRTNHVKPEDAVQRKNGITGVSNNNSIGITLVDAHRGHTPQQEEALKKLVGSLQQKFGIDQGRIFGHGELQSDRMSDEGKLAKVLRGNAPAPSAAAAPVSGDFNTRVAAAAKAAGVPDALIPFAVAQAGLESADGKSSLAKNGNNLFGVKADREWTGDSVDSKTTEVINGQRVQVDAKFRKYGSLDESVKDWWEKIQKNYPETAAATSVEQAVEGLYKGRVGNYATAPKEEYLKGIQSKIGQSKSLGAYGALPPGGVKVAQAGTVMSDASPVGAVPTPTAPPAPTRTQQPYEGISQQTIQRGAAIRQIIEQEDSRFLAGNDTPIMRQTSKAVQISNLIAFAEKFNDPYLLTEAAGAIDWSKLADAERQTLIKAYESQQTRTWNDYIRNRTIDENKRSDELKKFKIQALTEFRRTGQLDPEKWVRNPDGSIDADKEAYLIQVQETSTIPERNSKAQAERYIDDMFEASITGKWDKFAAKNGRIAERVNNGQAPTVDDMRSFFLDSRDLRPDEVEAINTKLGEYMDGAAILGMDNVNKFYNRPQGVQQTIDNHLQNAMLGEIILNKNPTISYDMREEFNRIVMEQVKASIAAGRGVPRAELGSIMREAEKEVLGMVKTLVANPIGNRPATTFTRPTPAAPAPATPVPVIRGPDGRLQFQTNP